jgi:hypothetical protein
MRIRTFSLWAAMASVVLASTALAGDCGQSPPRRLHCCAPPPHGALVQSLPILLVGPPAAPAQALNIPPAVTEAQLTQLLKMAQTEVDRRSAAPPAPPAAAPPAAPPAAAPQDCCKELEVRVRQLDDRIGELNGSVLRLLGSVEKMQVLLNAHDARIKTLEGR